MGRCNCRRAEALFAALSFRDPTAVVFRARLHPEDSWSTPSRNGEFQFVDLAPGNYDLEVAASVDRERWSEAPARLRFRVLRPWYAEPWFLSAAAIGIAGSAHLGYRLRMRRRLALERQRTRIAMDLHDEVGSGLGTIAVLAGITGRADIPEERRVEVAGRIAGVSRELAHSLGDIVWSLRTSSGSLDALWAQLLDRARPMFAAGTPRLTIEAPDPVPGEPLSLVVRRNLQLLALEALYNAARHAGPSVVALRLVRESGSWRLEVEDDGSGIDPDAAPQRTRRGLGLMAMRARAADMGGAIVWEAVETGGTRVVVRFRTGQG
jgi:signal transduction histidine kinase